MLITAARHGGGDMDCVGYVEAVSSVATTQELRALTSEVLIGLGFHDFVLSQRGPTPTVPRFGDFDRGHFDAYVSERLYLHDPVSRELTMSWLPVFWECGDFIDRADPSSQLFARSRQVGYECGVSLIVHGPMSSAYTMACISDGRPALLKKRRAEITRDLLVVAYSLGHAYSRMSRAAPEPLYLTPREKECLRLAMQGKTAWESSRIMGVRERTVNFHLQNAMAKLDTATKHQAWLKAAELGLLGLDS